MALSAFAPTTYLSFSATATSSRVVLPGGGGATLLVTNIGTVPVCVKLGDNTVQVNSSNAGIVVMPGQALPLTVGTATNIAAIALGFGSAAINLAQGT